MQPDRMIQPERDVRQPLDERITAGRRSLRGRNLDVSGWGRGALLAASVVLYAVSFLTPCSADANPWWYGGWYVFLWGLLFVWFVPFGLFGALQSGTLTAHETFETLFLATWLANVLLYFGWGLVRDLSSEAGPVRRAVTFLVPLAAALLAASGLLCPMTYAVNLTWHSPAYWVWLASMVVVAVGGLWASSGPQPDGQASFPVSRS